MPNKKLPILISLPVGIIAFYCGALFLARERFWLLVILKVALPFVPLILYALVGLIAMRPFLRDSIPDRLHPELDKQQTASLTLAGFCFTSLSLLVSFFKTEIQDRKPAPAGIILFFCCALVSFIASNITLRFRIKNLSNYASDGFVDNGFWCIIIGLWRFLEANGMTKVANVVDGLLVFYSGCLIVSLVYHVQISKKKEPPNACTDRAGGNCTRHV